MECLIERSSAGSTRDWVRGLRLSIAQSTTWFTIIPKARAIKNALPPREIVFIEPKEKREKGVQGREKQNNVEDARNSAANKAYLHLISC